MTRTQTKAKKYLKGGNVKSTILPLAYVQFSFPRVLYLKVHNLIFDNQPKGYKSSNGLYMFKVLQDQNLYRKI